MNFLIGKTAIGWIALVWTDLGLKKIQLPSTSKETTLLTLKQFLDEDLLEVKKNMAPQFIINFFEELHEYLRGELTQFSKVARDESAHSEFQKSIYKSLQSTGYGKTLSYEEMAVRIGKPKAARAVGLALGKNSFPILVPCHRVISKSKKIGGFTAPLGLSTKMKLLEIEGLTKI